MFGDSMSAMNFDSPTLLLSSAKLERPWPILAGVILVAILHHVTKPDPLKDIPGPWLAKYTSLLLAYHTRTGKRYLYVDQLHKVGSNIAYDRSGR